MSERGLWLDVDGGHRDDLAAFTERARRADVSAVVRLRERAGGLVVAWVSTGFDVLASRAVRGRVRPADLSAGADALLAGLVAMDSDGYVDPGFAMDSAWRGALPPDTGFVHLDDVPAREVFALAQRGTALVREHSGPQGPPPSLLDQDVLDVAAGSDTVGVPMRCVFALTAMGFVPDTPDEVVRVRTTPAWLRIDARFGSVYRRRGNPAVVLH